MQLQSEEFLSPGQPMNDPSPSHNAVRLELAAEALRRFSEVRFVARGSSMVPSIYPGDCLTVQTFGAETPRRGEIVLYQRDGEFCVHRIVGILSKGGALFYVLQGDALTDYDPPVAACELLGRVTSLERRGESLKPNFSGGILYRAMCGIIRRSRFVVPMLLRWHAMRQRDFLKATSRWTGPVQTKAERP
jgi:Peptidase S24-like